LYVKAVPRKPKKPQAAPGSTQRARELVATELRIIGGKHRGRKFLYSGDPLTRPMKDRVREAVFNLVGPSVVGTYALDLFAGTGALGLEAISRGAVGATLLERHFPTAELVKQNAVAVGMDGQVDVVGTDAFVWVRREIAGEGGRTSEAPWRDRVGAAPWLVFVSPPYDFYVSREADMLALIATVVRAAPAGSIVVAEFDERFAAAKLPDAESWDVRTYSPAIVGVYRIQPRST
jgi:16S rRNA (guanine966-N2)-methyltransferase